MRSENRTENSGWKTYFEFDVVICTKEKRYRVPTYAAPVDSAMDGRFEDIVCYKVSKLSVISR